ncbi:hypothetical protein GCM10023188_14140 [Pontibacter saemangeumensis]|uniref:NodB homology domain-containing protein n=1 Tax=Pontibacter saemangeumensis TaxID=1084525 RepID=A0ABP8LHM4_9BACT
MKPYSVLCVLLVLTLYIASACTASGQIVRKQVPDKVVVLTFDDGVASHATFVAPLLKRYGFGGTFFVCEFPPDFEDKTKYMTWEQIQQLDKAGFEVANHTRNHTHVTKMSKAEFVEELAYIEEKCAELQIRKPQTFAYPGYSTSPAAIETLKAKGYLFARAGGSRPYDPNTDHPYLIPSYSTTGDDKQRVLEALQQAKAGKIVVLTVHGVPDTAHDWVTTPPELFEEYLAYLKENNYKVIALRDLKQYVNVEQALIEIEPVFTNLMNKP